MLENESEILSLIFLTQYLHLFRRTTSLLKFVWVCTETRHASRRNNFGKSCFGGKQKHGRCKTGQGFWTEPDSLSCVVIYLWTTEIFKVRYSMIETKPIGSQLVCSPQRETDIFSDFAAMKRHLYVLPQHANDTFGLITSMLRPNRFCSDEKEGNFPVSNGIKRKRSERDHFHHVHARLCWCLPWRKQISSIQPAVLREDAAFPLPVMCSSF